MCLDCNNSLCSLDILPSLSISTSFPITSSLLFSHRPSICWSLCLRFSCDSFVNHALLSCSLFWFFCFSFLFHFPFALLFMYCLTTVLFLVLLPAYFVSVAPLLPLPLPLPPFSSRPSFLLSSLLFLFRCLSVRRWSQSSETPSLVRKAPACGVGGPSAAQRPCAILRA